MFSHLCDTFHHVLNVRADSLDSRQLLSDAEPFLHKQLLLANLLYVHTHVPEVPPQRAPRPSHYDLARLDGNLHYDVHSRNIMYYSSRYSYYICVLCCTPDNTQSVIFCRFMCLMHQKQQKLMH